jgi:hypothetical protein
MHFQYTFDMPLQVPWQQRCTGAGCDKSAQAMSPITETGCAQGERQQPDQPSLQAGVCSADVILSILDRRRE